LKGRGQREAGRRLVKACSTTGVIDVEPKLRREDVKPHDGSQLHMTMMAKRKMKESEETEGWAHEAKVGVDAKRAKFRACKERLVQECTFKTGKTTALFTSR
jgi:hypothetical protein